MAIKILVTEMVALALTLHPCDLGLSFLFGLGSAARYFSRDELEFQRLVLLALWPSCGPPGSLALFLWPSWPSGPPGSLALLALWPPWLSGSSGSLALLVPWPSWLSGPPGPLALLLALWPSGTVASCVRALLWARVPCFGPSGLVCGPAAFWPKI
jgi:hypothetical protein